MNRLAAAALVGVLACGYEPVYAARFDALRVKVVRSTVADPVVADEVASGVREALARAGALGAGEAYPRVEIEVTREGERSEGIRAVDGGPAARATSAAVVGRAWIARAAGGGPEADTGDLSAEQTLAVDESATAPDPRASEFHYPDAARAAARRLGERLGRRVLGLPAANEE